MLASHRMVLKALNKFTEEQGEWNYVNFKTLSEDTKMDRSEVRRIVRHLTRKGLAEFAKGLWTEDGDPYGSGYCITAKGIVVLEEESDA